MPGGLCVIIPFVPIHLSPVHVCRWNLARKSQLDGTFLKLPRMTESVGIARMHGYLINTAHSYYYSCTLIGLYKSNGKTAVIEEKNSTGLCKSYRKLKVSRDRVSY